jgi:CHAD domain-containing protein
VPDKTMSIIWVLPETLETEPLVADLKDSFFVESEPMARSIKTWFDTFDWRLYKNNFYLYADEEAWHLFRGKPDIEAASHPLYDKIRRVFSWDFSTGRLRLLIEPVLEMRSLMPLVTLESSTICLRILNKDDKIVARVFLAEHVLREIRGVYGSVKLQGVRGYERQFRKITRFFSQYGITEQTSALYPFEEGVKAGGRKPLDYSSRFMIRLKPEMSARQAMVLVYRELLEAMLKNESGVIEDLDSEFLHDFRVAIRRTRSGLGQIKNVLPAEITENAKKDFAWLGSITGPTRDLDVYLFYEQNYRARLPERLQKGLDTFFADLRSKRNDEQEKLVAQLKSQQYREIIAGWQGYLNGDAGKESTITADRPIIEPAREIIYRKYRKIMKDGSAITPSSPDDNLHRLRIQCKKLRYILEFFTSLFPENDMKRVIKHLKRLQNNLGDFNDLSVQQEMLRRYLADIKPGSRKNQELSVSLGGLLTNLYHEQHKVRDAFASRFSEFSASENAILYTTLFYKKVRVKPPQGATGAK